MAGLHGLPLAPAHPAAGVLALRLGESPVEGDEELALRVDGVDVLFLEDDGDAQAPKLPGVVEGIHCVPGKAGDRFRQDQVDLPLAALADHAQKFLPFGGRGAGDPLVREHARHGPARLLHDFLCIVAELISVAGELFLTVRGDSGVCGHPQIPLLRLLLGRLCLGGNDDNFWSGLCHCVLPPSMI